MVPALEEILRDTRSLVFFGGAGVSTESGIPDFRSVDGLYHQKFKYPPETMLSHTFYKTHTAEFYDFYRQKLIVHGAKVYELHGSTLRNYCTRCGKFYPVSFIEEAAGQGDGVPRCTECGGIVKPDVVLYEEGLDEATMENAIKAISVADTLIVGGTSLAVYPAAGLLRYFRGETLVVINKQPTPADGMANLILNMPIGQALDENTPVSL